MGSQTWYLEGTLTLYRRGGPSWVGGVPPPQGEAPSSRPSWHVTETHAVAIVVLRKVPETGPESQGKDGGVPRPRWLRGPRPPTAPQPPGREQMAESTFPAERLGA